MDKQKRQEAADPSGLPIISKVTSEHGARQLALLAREIWQEHYTPLIGAEQVTFMLAKFQSAEKIWQDISQNHLSYSQLELDGLMIGYMAAKIDPNKKTCFLSKIYILNAYRGRGYARLFLDNLAAECRDRGADRIWLTVNKGNSGSIAAYRKMGFHQDDAIVTDIGGGYVMDDYVMSLDLSADCSSESGS